MRRVAHRIGTDQFGTLLAPDAERADVNPCRSGTAIVKIAAHNGRVAVGGNGHRTPFAGTARRTATDQLASLLDELRMGRRKEYGG